MYLTNLKNGSINKDENQVNLMSLEIDLLWSYFWEKSSSDILNTFNTEINLLTFIFEEIHIRLFRRLKNNCNDFNPNQELRGILDPETDLKKFHLLEKKNFRHNL